MGSGIILNHCRSIKFSISTVYCRTLNPCLIFSLLGLPVTRCRHDAAEKRSVASVLWKHSPCVEELSPRVEEVSSSVEEVSPRVEELSPSVEKVSPSVEEVSPRVEELSPSVEELSPRYASCNPPPRCGGQNSFALAGRAGNISTVALLPQIPLRTIERRGAITVRCRSGSTPLRSSSAPILF